MPLKVVNKNIYTGCLVSFFSLFDAEPYGERILEIGRKLRKLCRFKESQCIILWSSVTASCTWKQPLNIHNALV